MPVARSPRRRRSRRRPRAGGSGSASSVEPGAELVELLQGFKGAQRVGLDLFELLAQGIGRQLHGQPQLLLRRLQRALALELAQYLAGARDDSRGETGQGGDVDAVRNIGATRHDPVKEANRLAFL